MFDENKELKTLYHTASEFEKIGQANLDFQKDGKYDTKCYESFLKIKDDNQDKETKDSEKFDLLRESIIQSSAIREKHSILQEACQEKLTELEGSAVERYNAKQKLEFVEQVSDYQKFKEEQKQDPELRPNNNAVLIENIIDWNSYSSVNLMGTAVTDYETRFNAEKRIEEKNNSPDNSQDNRKICVNSKSSLLGSEYIIPEDKSYVGYFDKGVKSFAEETLKETESVVKALEKFITTENVGGSKIPDEKGTNSGRNLD